MGCRLMSLHKRQSFAETINTAKGLRFARKPLFLHLNQSKSPIHKVNPNHSLVTSQQFGL